MSLLGTDHLGNFVNPPMIHGGYSTIPGATLKAHGQTSKPLSFDETMLHPGVRNRHKSRPIAKGSSQSPRKETFDMKSMEPTTRRHRRCFSEGERAIVAAVRKARACSKCHAKHRKVCSSEAI